MTETGQFRVSANDERVWAWCSHCEWKGDEYQTGRGSVALWTLVDDAREHVRTGCDSPERES